MKQTTKNLMQMIMIWTVLFSATLIFIFLSLYLTTYICTEMTQIEWLNWLFTGKGV